MANNVDRTVIMDENKSHFYVGLTPNVSFTSKTTNTLPTSFEPKTNLNLPVETSSQCNLFFNNQENEASYAFEPPIILINQTKSQIIPITKLHLPIRTSENTLSPTMGFNLHNNLLAPPCLTTHLSTPQPSSRKTFQFKLSNRLKSNSLNTLNTEALYSASFEVPSPSSPKPGLSNQEKRVKIIEEIFTTEADFLSSISFCYSLFYKKILDSIDGDEYVNSDEVNVVNNLTIKKPSQFNVDKLFGNMQDVIRLSRQLLSKLRATCHTENDNIGLYIH